MWQIFTGSLLLSAIHASIPNHWMPLIAIGKTEKWSRRETLSATFITGFAHTLSTVIIGIIVGIVGYRLSDSYRTITHVIAPAILVLLGLIYLVSDYMNPRKHHHGHTHFQIEERADRNPNSKIRNPKSKIANPKSKWAILLSLSVAMFFSPCIEIEAYYFRAGTEGWRGIVTVSAVYTVVTVLFMMVLVYLGMRGAEHLESHYLEHHDRQITGIVLVALGVLAFFFS